MAKDVKIILKTAADITGLTKLKRALESNVPGLNKLEKGFGALGRSIKKIGGMGKKTLQGVGVGITALGAALAGTTAQAVKFNVGLARVWTMMGGGIKDIRNVGKELRNISSDIGVTTSDLSNGLYQTLSAGIPKENAITFLRSAARTSRVDGATVEEAVQAGTAAINTFNLSAGDAEAVFDSLFEAVKGGNNTISELAQNMATAAPTFAQSGAGLDQFLAAIASLTQQKLQVPVAMTGIRNSVQILNKELGEGWSKTMTFQEGLEKVAREAGYSSVALDEIFGRETSGVVQALTGRNFSKAVEQLNKMGGAAGNIAKGMDQVEQLRGRWDSFWETVKNTTIEFGLALEKELQPTIAFLQETLNNFRKGDTFDDLAQGLADAVADFIAKLGAGIVTAVQAIKIAFQEGPTAIAATLKTLITEALTLAGTALIEFLRANVNVFVMLGKVVGNAIKAEVLKLNIPGLGGTRKEEGARGLQTMTYAEAQELFPDGLPGAGGGPRQANARILPGDAKVMAEELAKRDGGRGILAGLAGRTSGDDMLAAIAEGRSNFAGAAGRLGSQLDTSVGNIASTGSNALGMDLPGMFQNNYNQIADFQANIAPPAAAPQAPASSGAGPSVAGEVQDSGKAVVQELQKVIEITLTTNDGTVKKIEQLARAQEEMQAKLDNLPVQ